jgi:hypothetical protein
MKSCKEDNDDDEERKEGDFPSSFLSYCPFTAPPAVDTLKLGDKDDYRSSARKRRYIYRCVCVCVSIPGPLPSGSRVNRRQTVVSLRSLP